MARSRYDVVVAGGGHNGLVAAAYLARAGQSVLVLERLDHVGGLVQSAEVFPGVPARLSRYSYLVSLLPTQIIRDLDLGVELRPRRISSYTPAGNRGLLVDNADPARTSASFAAVTGGTTDWWEWQRFYTATANLAARVFPTMTEPLRSIGTFAAAAEASLKQNRCFLYHVIGNGTGAWQVPVGGMGAVTTALARAAIDAGAHIRTGAEVTAIDPGGAVTVRHGGTEQTIGAGYILANVAPPALAALLGEAPDGPAPEGAQLKINMVLARLPALPGNAVSPEEAFTGTFHVNEGYTALGAAFREAAAGRIPVMPPCEAYCHSLTDPSILGARLASSGAHTMTVFGLHMPARLFRADPAAARDAALAATLRSFDDVLAEPLADCLLADADGRPCLEVKTPADLEAEAGLPGGHIWHGDLAWPFTDDESEVGGWGVETAHPRVLICGAGARRGGGVSGIGGHNAAMAILRGRRRRPRDTA